jgi:hypothetical protein
MWAYECRTLCLEIHDSTVTVNYMYVCKIWGFHDGDYEEWCLLGCYAMCTSGKGMTVSKFHQRLWATAGD